MPTPAAGLIHSTSHLLSIDAGEQTITLAPVVRTPVVYGPLISQGGVDVAAIEAVLYHRDDLVTPVATLVDSYGRQWLDALNEAGSGSVTLQNDDPDLALVDDGDLIRFVVHGWAALTMLVQMADRVSIAPGEEVDEATTLTGPGHLAVFEEAVVYPSRGVDALPIEEDRVFSWASVDFDDSSWGPARAIAQKFDLTTHWSQDADLTEWPPESDVAWWLFANSGTQEWAAAGPVYFRHEFEVLSGVSRIVIYAVFDAQGDLYLDGQLLISSNYPADSWAEIRAVTADVTPGMHTLAVVVVNDVDPEGDEIHNPGGLLLAVHAIDTLGVVTSAPITYSGPGGWVMVEYPPFPPGMTPGEVIRLIVEEAQARGALLGVTLHFDDETDSDGVAWPEVTDIATKVGTDYLTFLREISATYIDIWMAPASLELWAWVKDGRGETQDVALTAGVNLAGLTHTKAI